MTTYKYARVERERRFLVRRLPDEVQQQADFTRIVDSYLTNTRLRLRRMESPEGELLECKLGQKYPVVAEDLERIVTTNIYLDENEYAILAALPGTRLCKRRYAYCFAEQRFSLDVFEELFEGLMICEIEIAEKSTAALTLPAFVDREITQDMQFTGGELANMSNEEIRELITTM